MAMKPRTMVSMELDDEDKMDARQPIAMQDRPDFPYGLRISLTEKEIEKLDIDHSSLKVGGLIHLHGFARITSVGSSEHRSESGDGKSQHCELQIEDLSIESEDEENENEDDKNGRG